MPAWVYGNVWSSPPQVLAKIVHMDTTTPPSHGILPRLKYDMGGEPQLENIAIVYILVPVNS